MVDEYILDVTVVLEDIISDSVLESDPVVSFDGSIVVLDDVMSVLEIDPVAVVS